MYISRKLVGAAIIIFLLALTTASSISTYYFDRITAFFFVLTVLITILVINWIGSEPQTEEKSQRKVEKLLRKLDDADLDLLRHRLMQDEREEEYGSMADLMQSGKRKNESS